MLPIRSVPVWTTTVATGPRPLSSSASMIVPTAGRLGSALSSWSSATRFTMSNRSSRPWPVLAETCTSGTSPPYSSMTTFASVSSVLTRSGFASGLSILLSAMMIGTFAARAWLIASSVCGMTPSSAATTMIAISVTLAPRARIAVNASCPGVSRKTTFLSSLTISEAPMCWVIPPRSPAATAVLRIASSRLVFPWSTWPMTVTIGARGTSRAGSPSTKSVSFVAGAGASVPSSSAAATGASASSVSKPSSVATSDAVSRSISWLIVAKIPLLMSSRITSAGLTARTSASSLTVIVDGSTTAARSRGSATETGVNAPPSRRCGLRGPRRPRVPLLLLAIRPLLLGRHDSASGMSRRRPASCRRARPGSGLRAPAAACLSRSPGPGRRGRRRRRHPDRAPAPSRRARSSHPASAPRGAARASGVASCRRRRSGWGAASVAGRRRPAPLRCHLRRGSDGRGFRIRGCFGRDGVRDTGGNGDGRDWGRCRGLRRLHVAADVDPPAGHLRGQPRVLPFAADGEREHLLGNDDAGDPVLLVDVDGHDLRRAERLRDEDGRVFMPLDHVDLLAGEFRDHGLDARSTLAHGRPVLVQLLGDDLLADRGVGLDRPGLLERELGQRVLHDGDHEALARDEHLAALRVDPDAHVLVAGDPAVGGLDGVGDREDQVLPGNALLGVELEEGAHEVAAHAVHLPQSCSTNGGRLGRPKEKRGGHPRHGAARSKLPGVYRTQAEPPRRGA